MSPLEASSADPSSPFLVWLAVASNLVVGLAFVLTALAVGPILRDPAARAPRLAAPLFIWFFTCCGLVFALDAWGDLAPTPGIDPATRVLGALGAVPAAVMGLRLARERLVKSDTAALAQANEELRAREAWYQEVLEASIDPSTLFEPVRDADGKVVDFEARALNRAASGQLGLLGVSAGGERAALRLSQMFPPDLFAARLEAFVEIARTGRARQFETERVDRDGRHRHYVSTAAPFRAGVAVYGRDVTAEREAEARLVAELREREGLIRELHHRVRNTLQLVASLARLEARTAEASARRSLDVLQRRVLGLARVYDTAYGPSTLAEVELASWLPAMVARGRPEGGGEVEVQVEPGRVPLDTAVTLGLVVDELVGAAGAGPLGVRLERAGEGRRLLVRGLGAEPPEGASLVDLLLDGLGAGPLVVSREGLAWEARVDLPPAVVAGRPPHDGVRAVAG